MQVHHVVQRVAAIEVAQHAHDRGDPAPAGADGRGARAALGQPEGARRPRAHDRPGCASRTSQGATTPSTSRGDADEAVGAPGSGERIGSPVVRPRRADAQVAAGAGRAAGR
jgi:hypothetical protein